MKEYNEQEKALNKIGSGIQSSIGMAYVQITYDCDDTLAIMTAIKAEFKPMATKRLILSDWNHLMATDLAKGITDVTVWLINVESKYNDA